MACANLVRVVRDIHRAVSYAVRSVLDDARDDEQIRGNIAKFGRKAADILGAGDPSFSYDWFFGACGLDNWGELFPLLPSERASGKPELAGG